jgi:hypothetical protein
MSEEFSSKGTSSKNDKAVMIPGSEVKAHLVEVTVDDKGDMTWVFKNSTGGLQHKEFAIDRNHPKYKQEVEESVISRIKHLACAFLGEAEESKIDAIVAHSYAQWAKQVAAMVMASPNIKEEVTLKVVVNPKNYIGFPLFPNFISSKVRPLRWIVNPKYDVFVFSEKKPDAAPKDAVGGEGDFSNNTDESDDTEF